MEKILDKGYCIVTSPTSGCQGIQCLNCGKTSWYSADIEHRYCVICDIFHDDEKEKRRLLNQKTSSG